jgi:CheY-like chemotaxis protein
VSAFTFDPECRTIRPVLQGPQVSRSLTERKPSDKRPRASRKTDPAEPEPASTSGLSVLIVDDAKDTREMYAMYFEHVGARTAMAHDGRSALQSVQHDPPDVIVLDLAMPGGTSGWDVIRRLKSSPETRAIPIVVVSGQNARSSALRAGAEMYLEKPCPPAALYAALLQLPGRDSDT